MLVLGTQFTTCRTLMGYKSQATNINMITICRQIHVYHAFSDGFVCCTVWYTATESADTVAEKQLNLSILESLQ